MEDLNVIDQFVATFSTYIDSGFGLLQGDVAYLTSILIAIDITLAGLFWAMGPDTDIIGRFLKKVLYVGAFALILGNFAVLSDVVFRSFAQLGLNATGGTLTADDIIPFALWNKTSFLAEKVLGNVIASGIKLMVLAIIVGIGSTIFTSITSTFEPDNVTLEQAASVILGSLALLALGLFGPGIATGLVSGAPQLGAGAAVGTAAGVAAGAVAGGTVAKSAVSAVAGGGRSAVGAAASMAGGARTAYSLGAARSGKTGMGAAAAGMGGVASAGVQTAAFGVAGFARRAFGNPAARSQAGSRAAFAATGGSGATPSAPAPANDRSTPDWASRIRRSQATRDASMMAASAVRDGDRPGGGTSVQLKSDED